MPYSNQTNPKLTQAPNIVVPSPHIQDHVYYQNYVHWIYVKHVIQLAFHFPQYSLRVWVSEGER